MSAAAKDWSRAMNIETIVSIVVCALLLVYLTYALLRPEKF
jgi:K+-transporting ATPase KdpF subunit